MLLPGTLVTPRIGAGSLLLFDNERYFFHTGIVGRFKDNTVGVVITSVLARTVSRATAERILIICTSGLGWADAGEVRCL